MAWNDRNSNGSYNNNRYSNNFKSNGNQARRYDAAAHAPYNFVPFSDNVLERYQDISQIPGHDVFDPKLKTGEIHITLTADTPVLVSDGKGEFVRDAAGNVMIPGSSIRGMIRQNMQILGFGLVRSGKDIMDRRIFYRDVAGGKQSVSGSLSAHYRSVMKLTAGQEKNAVPQAVRAGYLHKDKDGYYILPANGSYLCVKRDHPGMRGFQTEDPSQIHARWEQVVYANQGDTVTFIAPEGKGSKGKHGALLFTGRWVGKDDRRRNKVYLFPEVNAAAEKIRIPEDDVLNYRMDWEARKNNLKGGRYNPNFWALQEDESNKLPAVKWPKPVFYLQYQGHVYFGMTRYLRIGYEYSIAQGLPYRHQNFGKQKMFLDYPSAILGFSENEQSYRSRVSFGNFLVQGAADTLPPQQVVAGEPKPSWYPGYVEGEKHYNQKDFRIRGYKQYWFKAPNIPQIDQRNRNVSTILNPLKKDTVFKGVIRYKNLHEDELGLLLWALRLENGQDSKQYYQSLGMGKAFGYGRMKLTIDGLKEYDPKKLYEDLCSSGDVVADEKLSETIEGYIKAYDVCANALLKEQGCSAEMVSGGRRSLLLLQEIQDFMYLHSKIRTDAENVSYLQLREYRNLGKPLETVKDVRGRDKKQ